jgi:hypothetical protein
VKQITEREANKLARGSMSLSVIITVMFGGLFYLPACEPFPYINAGFEPPMAMVKTSTISQNPTSSVKSNDKID